MGAPQSASWYASVRDVEAATERFAGSEVIEAHRRLWGPVLDDVAFATGALAPASSVLIRPAGASQLESAAVRAMALFPADVFPSAEDTADTLAARLGGSGFLDDIHFKKGGHGKGGATMAINKSKCRQPRRKTWSVVVDSSQDEALLFAYTQYGRKPSDWRSSPMPMEVFELLVLVWRLAMPYLGALSRASPPTAVQVMMYYVLFDSNVGRHRDNFSSRDLHRWLETGKTEAVGHTVSADTNSQVLESDVLLWAEGNTGMVITLSFPRPADRFGKRDAYIVHPAFRFTSERGTLFVFKWQDDLFFCHQADFDKAVLLAAGAAGYRFVFVFRWLQSIRTFNCGSAVAHIPHRTSTTTASASANMISTDELVEKERVRQGTKRRRAESDRRAACRIGV